MAHSVHQIPVAGFDKNFSYIIADSVTREAYIVDPNGDFIQVSAQVAAHHYHVIGILLTHTHHDHIDQLTTASDQYDVPIYVHTNGIMAVASYADVRSFDDHTILPLGAGHMQVLHTPGHTDDSVCFYISATEADDGVAKLITGDTLFVGGCGRTTALRVKDLYESLQEIAALPDETVILPGHDYGPTPTSTIGYEKKHNRFYQVQDCNEFIKLRLQ